MAISGRRPKPPGVAINRNRPLHGWTEVPDQPNRDAPELPPRRRNGRGWPDYARQLWAVWSSQPHTIHWTASDWAFCLEALELAVRCSAEGAPVSAWVELRAREKAMGCTWDSRQGMRLRYVAPVEDSDEDSSVSQLDDYRNL
ncbi:MAG TPA: hypothetical protein VER10_12330 [Mycobacterium sp.]|nr:hypothetical protein [Mycobacterium sp.]